MTVREVYEHLYKDGELIDDDKYIKICEDNISALATNKSSELIDDDYSALCKIRSEYAIRLSNKGYYKLAAPEIESVIELWERHLQPPLLIQDNRLYEQVRFHKAIVSYRLKDIDASRQEFEWLVSNYPKNDRYKDWLSAIKREKLGRYQNIAMYICFIAILMRTFVMPDNEESRYLSIMIYCLCIIVMLSLGIRKMQLKAKAFDY